MRSTGWPQGWRLLPIDEALSSPRSHTRTAGTCGAPQASEEASSILDAYRPGNLLDGFALQIGIVPLTPLHDDGNEDADCPVWVIRDFFEEIAWVLWVGKCPPCGEAHEPPYPGGCA